MNLDEEMEFDWFIQLHPMFRLPPEEADRLQKKMEAEEREKRISDLFIIFFCLVIFALIFCVA